MAEDLGKRLVAEIEEVCLDEIFQSLRLQDDSSNTTGFGVPPLDRLLQTISEAMPKSMKARPTPPIVELTSLAPGGGKTHLLYCLTALAVLPVYQGGKQACAIIIDTDGSFSVPRLAHQLSVVVKKHPADSTPEIDTINTITSALRHVHIFRPQSLPSTLATLDSLPTYLFNKTKHHSIDRSVAFIALDSASASYWQHRAEEDDATLLQNTSSINQAPTTPAKPSGYTQLTTALKAASACFSCPVILTSWHLGPASSTIHTNSAEARTLRPSLATPLSQLPTLRLIVQRVTVRRFPAGISVEEARREAAARQKAVAEGKFEAVANEWGVDERTLQKLQAGGAGFGFRITDEEGLTFDGKAG